MLENTCRGFLGAHVSLGAELAAAGGGRGRTGLVKALDALHRECPGHRARKVGVHKVGVVGNIH